MFDVSSNRSKLSRLLWAARSVSPPPPDFQPLTNAGGPA